MTKIFGLIFTPMIVAASSEQLVVVLGDDVNVSQGILQRYERKAEWEKTGLPVPVILGRSGMGFEQGALPLKREGDGRSPAGIFPVMAAFGYSPLPNSALPYLYADDRLICIDDSEDPDYNRVVPMPETRIPKSYEKMHRDDELYRNGAVIGYNAPGLQGRGSCIFFHLKHPDNTPTSGCTSMEENDLKTLLGWFKSEKEPMVLQIPVGECSRYQERFRGIECPLSGAEKKH
ncbi:MAG: L,D-transpeptidase [Sulfuricurvum sp.]